MSDLYQVILINRRSVGIEGQNHVGQPGQSLIDDSLPAVAPKEFWESTPTCLVMMADYFQSFEDAHKELDAFLAVVKLD